jgi:hypothetical protein
MFQKDYWRMPDEEIKRIATKCHIDSSSKGTLGYRFDREKTIDRLLIRDNALRTKVTTVLSILALLLSTAAFIKSFLAQQ